MKISPLAGSTNPYVKNNNKVNNNTSFKSIFINSSVIATRSNVGVPLHTFLPKDSIVLNKISYAYPNQDCFITRGDNDRPALLFREKPPEVTVYNDTATRERCIRFDKDDETYRAVPLILYPSDDEGNKDYFLNNFKSINRILGLCPFNSQNPSLKYTVKIGYELHKALMEIKYQLEEAVGSCDVIDFGGPNILDKAHKAMEELEIAVTRLLLEFAYFQFSNERPQYEIPDLSDLRVLVTLQEERKQDLRTNLFNRLNNSDPSNSDEKEADIFDYAMKEFPNIQENKERIKELSEYILENYIHVV